MPFSASLSSLSGEGLSGLDAGSLSGLDALGAFAGVGDLAGLDEESLVTNSSCLFTCRATTSYCMNSYEDKIWVREYVHRCCGVLKQLEERNLPRQYVWPYLLRYVVRKNLRIINMR